MTDSFVQCVDHRSVREVVCYVGALRVLLRGGVEAWQRMERVQANEGGPDGALFCGGDPASLCHAVGSGEPCCISRKRLMQRCLWRGGR